jgi:hypothetical protein
LAAESVKPFEIIRMHSASPFIAGDLFSSLGQAVYGRVAGRGLHLSCADVDREAANAGCFPDESELCIAVG